MRVLLDTQIFLWAITDDPRLSREHSEVFLNETYDVLLSTVSVWEIVIKCSLGRLQLPKPAVAYIGRQMEKNRVQPLALHLAHLDELERLPPIHKDPFDRLLVAQAGAEQIPLVSADSVFRQYPVQLL
jgi:PIN domain nuclease of toxin-antitoxin system